ncbi:MAG: acyl carrier protein [Gammaproteobacteria bacterium]|nr:acyl carrier protein [Gammaproteobacteria bacterium]MDE0513355.1 acyl carrier protein [Gammaproteobacteria bacterium]
MATTEERVRQLVSDNLEVDGQPLNLSANLNTGLTELGVSSLDVVAFAKLVSKEFNITFTIEDCETVNTIQKLIDHLGG